ncbi:MAG TPA: patatin-like phospholipase family protein [Longimicrobiaceae bacterium]|nr:patatin-like phospholipase family protein [Longimicrobiaceae bacterium]
MASSRELRLGFAMGGGVSLGAFSGAALSEAIKLAILRARWTGADGKAHPYDRVVVDVFSGASAGAMSLALMLRLLISRDPAQEESARERVLARYGKELQRLARSRGRDGLSNEGILESLVAAQVVQDVQERVWVHDVSLDGLLGYRGGQRRDLRYEAGILDRAAVDGIARRELLFREPFGLERRRLLGDRVLFACTLTSVTPILYDARDQALAYRSGYLGLADGFTSFGHRDLRIFDLRLAESLGDEAASRWCRYHVGDEREGVIGDLRTNHTWARIAATAVAAGAFPFAFAPVVLTRKRYEYGDRLWPKPLAARQEYPFTYVDGGMFNNEPIREAFRLASFMDAERPGGDFDRRIVFVDPNVGSLEIPLRVPVHTEYFLEPPNRLGSLDGIDLRRLTTLDRLVRHARSMGAAVLDESRSVEKDKVYATRSDFERRDLLRASLADAFVSSPEAASFSQLRSFCESELAEEREQKLIPVGGLSLRSELERVAAEEERFLPLRGRADAFLALTDPAHDPHAGLWLRALACVALDLAMGLEGKRDRSRLIAIAPFVDLDPVTGTARAVPLPGAAVGGFGGFASVAAGSYEAAIARHCAREFMEACGLVAPAPDEVAAPVWSAEQNTAFRRDLEAGIRKLADRIADVVRDAHLFQFLPGVDALVLNQLASRAREAVRKLSATRPATHRSEFHVRVPDGRYELDGRGLGDRDVAPVPDAAGGLRLITFADYAPDPGGGPGTWSGPQVHEDTGRMCIRVDYDGRGPLPDRTFCTIALPDRREWLDSEIWPHPVFEGVLRAGHRGHRAITGFWTIPTAPGVRGLEGVLDAE